MNDVLKINGDRLLEFQLGHELYAVELLKVREVITIPETTPIPKAPSHVLGLMNLRGLVLTVVDLRKRLGIQPHQKQDESAVIVFDLEDRLIGAQVDAIHRVLVVNQEHIKPVPDGDYGAAQSALKSVIQVGDKLTLWLDVKKLIDQNTGAPLMKVAQAG
jgi:purine-binding chemotaxis protein CheW